MFVLICKALDAVRFCGLISFLIISLIIPLSISKIIKVVSFEKITLYILDSIVLVNKYDHSRASLSFLGSWSNNCRPGQSNTDENYYRYCLPCTSFIVFQEPPACGNVIFDLFQGRK